MKNIIIIILFTLLSCTKGKEEPINNIPSELIGKWKIFKIFESDGNCIDNCWVEFDSGKEFDLWLKSDGTYLDSPNNNCNNCTYYLIEDKLFFLPYGEDSPGKINLLNDNYLTLWWNDFEGFGHKYKKIIE